MMPEKQWSPALMVLNSPGNNYVTVQNFNLASLHLKGFDIE